MSLEDKSQELKKVIATYDTRWLLGDLASIMHAGKARAKDQLGELSSPQRQLYYLAGLNITSDPKGAHDIRYEPEKWAEIVKLLNEIEHEYQKLFFPSKAEEITDEWKRIRRVAMPSFLGYFNQGPLNYEEQVINWVNDLYCPLDNIITPETGLKTEEFIEFYNNLDKLVHKNFQGHSGKKELLRKGWEKYTNIKMGVVDDAPEFIKEMGEQYKHLSTFMADPGIKDRFYPTELTSAKLSIEKVQLLLNLLATVREQTDFLYYTETKPGNPLFEKPIIHIEDDLYQVFEVKQVIHAIEQLLEKVCTSTQKNRDKYVAAKGNLLEDRVIGLFTQFLKGDVKIHKGYYVDGNEQDILILWRKYAFIIEAKGYGLREPLRNPERAFTRIKDDFSSSIGYGYRQTHRVEQKFIDKIPLRISDGNGNIIDEINTTQYEGDFSIIVNLKTFGQVQCDLSTLLQLNDDDVYPWAVKLDDLEIFILTLIAKKKTPKDFVDFLMMRENLHGHLICFDELDVCGGFMVKKINQRIAEDSDTVIITTPDLGDIFDKQYQK